jgi:hypothetical protein
MVRCCAPTMVPNQAYSTTSESKTSVRPKFQPYKKDLAPNYLNSGVDCYKQSNGYSKTQMASTVRHVFRIDKGERKKNTIVFNVQSQRNILVEIGKTEGHDDADYIYTT